MTQPPTKLSPEDKGVLRAALRNYDESIAFMIDDYGEPPHNREDYLTITRMQADRRRIRKLFETLALGGF